MSSKKLIGLSADQKYKNVLCSLKHIGILQDITIPVIVNNNKIGNVRFKLDGKIKSKQALSTFLSIFHILSGFSHHLIKLKDMDRYIHSKLQENKNILLFSFLYIFLGYNEKYEEH